MTATRIHVLVDFLGGDGAGARLQLVHLRLVLLAEVLITRLIQVRWEAREAQRFEVGARAWIGQVRRRLEVRRAGCRGTEARNLDSEGNGER